MTYSRTFPRSRTFQTLTSHPQTPTTLSSQKPILLAESRIQTYVLLNHFPDLLSQLSSSNIQTGYLSRTDLNESITVTEEAHKKKSSKMSETQTYTDENGAQIIVCQPDQLEHCGRCQMDFTEINDEARAEAAIAAGKEPNDDF
ncbi:hypothetical protein PGT21_020518 [Puccinia graminis f. sp. tritici]|uniref:Uncharacterized protein n=1 Tax=Puccinia graminis f. sp. tritici TaxID=56615 RepID=A0A5B0M333_PUCGR|nr:hypothetical protein PGT21_020518 [Puccinia graminis f. sp. tritici]